MTKDYMRSGTMMDYTAFDVHYASFRRGQEKKIEQMARRRVRRITKAELRRFEK